MRKAIAIVGPTLSGNMGGAAMIATTIQQAEERFGPCDISVLSYRYKDDLRLADAYGGPKIVPMGFVWLGLVYLPIAIVIWPLRHFDFIKHLVRLIPYYRTLVDADVVIDQCGVSFVDGRGIPLLVYNLACCLPALAVETPVVKLSQSLGPFRETFNRGAALFVLPRLSGVVARGEESRQNLLELGLADPIELPDTTFALAISSQDRTAARDHLARKGIDSKPIIFSPSEVVKRLSGKHRLDYESEFEKLIRLIAADTERRMVLLPHSLALDSSKNNDVAICRSLADRLSDLPVDLIHDVEDPRLLRAMLGMAHLHVGCRFHSVVGALSMGVPSLIVGWGHKYREMAAPLQGDRWGIDWREFTAESAFELFQELCRDRENIRANINKILPDVFAASRRNYDIGFSSLNNNTGMPLDDSLIRVQNL